MDKSKLLEEFVKLKGLLNQYENGQAATNNFSFPRNKCSNQQSREKIKSTIFFNPTKLNAVHNGRTNKVLEKSQNHTSTFVTKVFINPNFKQQELSSSTQVSSNSLFKRKEEQNHLVDHLNKNIISTSLLGLKKTRHQQQFSTNHDHKVSELPVAEKKIIDSSNHVIFVNPAFPSSSKHNAQLFDTTSQITRVKNNSDRPAYCNRNLISGVKEREQTLALKMSRKRRIVIKGNTISESSTNDEKRRKVTEDNVRGVRKIFVNPLKGNAMTESSTNNKKIRKGTEYNIEGVKKIFVNPLKGNTTIESSSNDQKRKQEINSNIRSLKKIFVNPKFEKKENDSRNLGSSNTGSISSDMQTNYNLLAPSNSNIRTMDNRGTSKIPVLLGGKEVPTKCTSVIYPLCTIVGSDRGKQVGKKIISQRIRTRSTSLVTVSTTKLIRKRRMSQKIIEQSEQMLPQPVFLSKTKLVRYASKNKTNNICVAKIKVKQLSQKTPAQCTLTDKVQKLRRKSLTDSSFNMISQKPKPVVVTKIKSKNGKSLKLIRKSTDTMSSSTVGAVMKTQNLVKSRKMELRQQASKAAMCLIKNRLKRNQYSKINVPVKVPHSPSYNINIYKKNNVESRKPLTKATLVRKKEAAKTQIRNIPLDLTKFIKSKYRLIRKSSSNTTSKLKLNHKITLRNKLIQRKKLKWKRKSNTPKRKLTRKDLSIKKIDGVFYRYSRTTLTKNKPSSKQVSQLQRKSIYQVASESRQNRFCLNKNPGRKRTSFSGGFLTPSGMSWKRTGQGAARSILTQAKQKSIFLLSKKMKKNNEPCLFFHRLGQCSGHERGTCVRLHDKKYVAVCKKFVQGLCTDDKCRLNHSPSCHNMPTCHHFLAGQCGRDHCPYPHIKVSDCAPVCLDFLKGYCQLGDQCAKRHFEICPSFEKGVCARGKYCPYPHPKNKTSESLKGKFKHIKRKPIPPKEVETVSTPSLRYFEDVNLQKENQDHLDENLEKEDSSTEVEDEEVVTCLKKRPQLGELPSFIPLSQTEDS